MVDRGDPTLFGVPADFPWANKRLHGKVFGDTRGHLADGSVVTTTPIIGRKGDLIVTKSGSLYQLGEVEQDHGTHFPNQRKNLLACLMEISP